MRGKNFSSHLQLRVSLYIHPFASEHVLRRHTVLYCSDLESCMYCTRMLCREHGFKGNIVAYATYRENQYADYKEFKFSFTI